MPRALGDYFFASFSWGSKFKGQPEFGRVTSLPLVASWLVGSTTQISSALQSSKAVRQLFLAAFQMDGEALFWKGPGLAGILEEKFE